MPEPVNVLFICTGNCCRSQMAEALLRHIGGERFAVFSAGSNPAGYVHPLAIEALRRMGISTEGQFSKGWEEFAAEPMDAIITVCDSVAERGCPAWPGQPATAHWGVPDPSFVPGSLEERLEAAATVARQLRCWIEKLTELPLERMDLEERELALRQIPRI